MPRYVWTITKDHLFEPGDKCLGRDEAGVTGPRGAAGPISEGSAFRMFDDDGSLYYEGVIAGDFTGFEPLDDFGTPNAGCTAIKYLRNGEWEVL